MDKERLKLIVKNMKSLVNCLESEIYSDPESYMDDSDYWKVGLTYSEDNDDDGYTDWMKDRKAAKKIIKRAKENPQLYTEQEVLYAKLFRRATKKKKEEVKPEQ